MTTTYYDSLNQATTQRGSGDPTYKALTEAEERGVFQKFSDISQKFETSASRRGITRSGFAAEEENKIGAEEQTALANVHAGVTDRLLQYKYQQDQLNVMNKQQKMQQKSSRNQWLGIALQVVGGIAGALI